MFSPTISRWIHLLKKRSLSPCGSDFKIHVISDNSAPDGIPPILKRYFSGFVTGKTLKDFSLSDIISSKYHFAGRPGKDEVSSSEDRFKRSVLKLFHPNYEKKASVWSLVDAIFLPSEGNTLFCSASHIAEIYKIHFPDFSVNEFHAYFNNTRNRLIYFLAQYSSTKFLDKSSGVTVFTNMAEPALLKAYKLLHPNKTVYVHFHDGLEHITEKKSSVESFRETIHRLIKENIIKDAESYHKTDAEILGITYRPNAVNGDVMKTFDAGFRKYLYSFIGAYKDERDLTRLNDLKDIRKEILALYPASEPFINERILSVRNFKSERIEYAKYLELVGESECFIDMYRIKPDEGLSYRTSEALLLGRKTITNRLSILDYDFYDPSRFFIIGHDPIEHLKDFITGEFKPLPLEILEQYDSRNWWKA